MTFSMTIPIGAYEDTDDYPRYSHRTSYERITYYIQKPTGPEIIAQLNLNEVHTELYENDFTFDTSSLPEGAYQISAALEWRDLDTNGDIKTISYSSYLIVDRISPVAKIEYPAKSSKVCIRNYSDSLGDWYGIPIYGEASDNIKVQNFEIYYGEGENPDLWKEALTRVISNENGKAEVELTPITGESQTKGQLGAGAWAVDGLKDGEYSLLLKVTDINGNTSCYATNFTFDRTMKIDLSADKSLFSPNGDGIFDNVTATFDIEKYATVDAKVFHLSKQDDDTFIPDQSPIGTIATGLQHVEGAESIIWNGMDDNGVAVPDGKYNIEIDAMDSCGNVNSKSVMVEVDNTPPATVITYPQAQDDLGNIVEIKGTVDDIHFVNYILEAGQGDNPDNWVQISSGKNPVNNDILGKWNTFGLEGTWTLRLTANDSVGNQSITSVTLNLGQRKTLIKNLGATPALFSPNNDGKLDTTVVNYELTDTCQIKIEILDATDAIQRNYATTQSAGIYTYTWDGNNDAGVVVPDGYYKVRLTAALSSNTSVTQAEAVTVAVDVTSPTIDIKQPLSDSYLKYNTFSVTGTIADNNIREYSISYTGDGGNISIDAGNQNRQNYIFGTLTELPEGKYTLNISAKDNAENITVKNTTFTVDKTPPSVVLNTPKNGEYYGSSNNVINVTGSIVEKNLDKYSVRYGAGDSPAQWTELLTGNTIPDSSQIYSWKVGKNDDVPDGLYTLSLYAQDKAGWTGEAKVKIIIDNTPPDTSITSLKNGDYVKSAVDIQGTAFDTNLDNYTLEMSEGQCGSAFKWVSFQKSSVSVKGSSLGIWQTIPADGDYCIRLTAKDKVGQQSETKVQVKVDTTPPSVPVLSGNIVNKTDASFNWTKNTETDLAGYNLYRDGQKVNSEILTAITFTESNLKEGTYKYTVKAVDLAGNESKSSNEVAIKIDLTPPAVRISSPVDGARVSSLVDIKGTAFSADDFKQYQVYIGQGSAPVSWNLIRTSPVPVNYGSLAQWDTMSSPDGVYTIKLEGEDINGNAATYQVGIIVDNTPPVAPFLLTAVPNGSDVTLTWKANTESDLAGYLLYRNDQLANVTGIVVGNLKPYMLTGTTYVDKALPDGKFKYYLVAMDQAGNTSDPSNTIEVNIDTHAPHITITEPLDTAKFQNKTLIRGESPDLDIASVQFQYKKVQDTTWINLGSAITKTPFVTYIDPVVLGLTYGNYNVRAVATDKTGNVDPSPMSVTLNYTDLTAPAAPVNLKASVKGADVSLVWSANQETDLNGYNVYRIYGDGEKTQVNTSILKSTAYQDNGLAEGDYIYSVTALDTYSNESQSSNNATVKIYAPQLSQPYTPVAQQTVVMSGSNAGANKSVEMFVDAGMGPVSQGVFPADAQGKFNISGLNLLLGENKITGTAKDTDGNISKTSDAIYVVADEVPSAPTGLISLAQNYCAVLTWNQNPESNISGYNLYSNGIKINASLPVTTGSVTASYIWNSYPPQNAFDGNSSTYWISYNSVSEESPAWWEIDLPSSELINHVEINWLSQGDGTVYGGKNYEVQVWSGHAWITHNRVTDNTSAQNVFDFSPSYRTDKIRIYITGAQNPYYLGLTEVNINKDNLITQTNYNDLNLTDGRYKYKVTAVDYYGFESVPSDEIQATIGDVVPPNAPQNLVAVASDSNVILNWDANTEQDLAGYAVYRQNGADWIRLNGDALISTNNYTDTGLANGTYIYRVTAIDMVNNESLPSNEAQAVVYIAPPQPPINLSISLLQDGSLNAMWSYSGQLPSGYNLYRSTISGGPYVKVNDNLIIANSFSDVKNLTKNTTYYYVVTALDAFDNESNYSSESAGTTSNIVYSTKPVIYYPTVSGVPITLYTNITDISGNAKYGSTVDLFNNDTFIGEVSASEKDDVRNIVLDGVDGLLNVSPDEKMALYIKNNSVWLKDLTDSSVKQIPALTKLPPVWSPDSTQIAIINSDNRVSLYDIKTGVSTALTSDNDVYEQPTSWSSDGSKIAYVRVSKSDNSSNIWIKNLNNGELKQITTSGSLISAQIKISPDGTKIAYFENDGIFVINLEDLNVIQIDSQTDAYSFNWSPDSKKIAYVSIINTPNSIRIADVEANALYSEIYSPDNQSNVSNPIWSPDGQSIMFVQNNQGVYSVSEVVIDSGEFNTIIPEISELNYIDWKKSGDIVYFSQNILNFVSRDGQFNFKDVELIEGENKFYAIASDAFGNQSTPSDDITVIYKNTSTTPDLAITADDISIYPPYPKPGDKVSIYVSPRNTGAVDVANVDVAIYLQTGDTWKLLNYETISSIAAGTSQLLHYELSDLPVGVSTVFVSVDPENTISEISEDNNTASKDIVVMEQNGVVMTTTLDAAQYTAVQDVNISVDLKNSGEGVNATLLVDIEDENGGIAAQLSSVDVAMPYASANNFSFVWNTAGTFDGKYRVHSILKANGAVVAENTSPFSILPDINVQSFITTDKTSYGSNENVSINASVTNSSKNHIIANLIARIKITDASGNILFTEDKNLTNILNGSSNNVGSIWITGNSNSGTYGASIEIILDNQIVSAKTTSFTIDSFVQITGSITAVSPSVVFGSNEVFNYSIQNSGNIALSGLDVKVLIIDPDSQSILSTGENILDLIISAVLPGNYSVSTQGYLLKTYKAVLQYTYNGVTKNIATTTFTVKDGLPPVITTVSPLADKVYGSQINLTVNATDDSSGVDKVEYRIDSGDWKLLPVADASVGRYSTTWNASLTDEGRHVVGFRATDKAGNVSNSSNVNITVNLTPLVVQVTSPANNTYVNTPNITVTGTISEAVQTLTVNGVAAQITGTTFTLSNVALATGVNNINVVATDQAGNTGTATVVVILDTTAPIIQIATPANSSNLNTPVITLTGTVNEAVQSVMVNGVAAQITDTNFTLSGINLTEGMNNIRVEATDLAGNLGVATISVTLDTTLPIVQITSPVNNSYLSTPGITVTGTISETTQSVTVNGVAAQITGTTFTLSGVTLVDGLNNITVKATDLATNVGSATINVILDTTPPVVQISTPANSSNVNTPVITVTGTVNEAVQAVTVNGIAAQIMDRAFTLSGVTIAEGLNNVKVEATDLAGNIGTTTAVVTLDTALPMVQIASPINNSYVNTPNITVTGTVSKTVQTVTVNGVAAQVSGTNYALTGVSLTEGANNTITVEATDLAGNKGTASITVNLDTAAPIIQITSPANNSYINTPIITLTGNVNETVTSVKVNGVDAQISGNNFILTGISLTEGANAITVEATDLAGNKAAASITVNLDTAAPVVQITSPINNSYLNTPTITVTGMVSEAVQSVTVNGTPAQVTGTNFSLGGVSLADGSNSITVEATDLAGNKGTASVTVILDTTPPVIQITSETDNTYLNTSNVTITGTVSETVQSVTINGVAAQVNGTIYTVTGISLSEGVNTITVKTTDLAGNVGTASIIINLDIKPPVITPVSPLTGKIYGSQVDLTVTATDDSSGLDKVEYKIDSGDWKLLPVADVSTGKYSITWSTVKTDEGSHTVNFRASDKAGNFSNSPDVNITVDLTPPVVTVISPTADKIYGTQVNLTVTATDTASGVDKVEYKIDSGDWKQLTIIDLSTGKYSATWNTVKSDEGSHTVSFRATDKVGNISNLSTVNIVIDLTPPGAPAIISPANNSTLTTNIVDINGTAEAGSIVTMVLAGATTNTQADTTTGAFLFKGVNLISGTNTFAFTTTDKAGNVSAQTNYTLTGIFVTSGISVNKSKYTINENLVATSSVTNTSTSGVLQNLILRLIISNSQGATVFTEDKQIANIDPQKTIQIISNWNTAVNPVGMYVVKINIINGTNVLSSSNTSFEILGTSITGDGMSGAVTVKPDYVYTGDNENINYAIANNGNEDVTVLNYNIKVIDQNQNVKKVFSNQQAITKGGTIAASSIVSTTGYSAGIYTVKLEVKTAAMADFKTISATTFEVKAGMEITKAIPDNINILVWVNKKCNTLQGVFDISCLCDDDKNSVRNDLLEKALKDASVSYYIVYNKSDFQRELRNSSFTDYMILGDRYVLDENYADELREQVYAGKGLVSSLYVKYGEPGPPVSGALWAGYLLLSHYTIDLNNTVIATGGSFVASGKTTNVIAYTDSIIAGRIRTILNSPAILLNNYGQGKSVYYAFDLGETINDQNYGQLSSLINNSIIYAHKSSVVDSFPTHQLVPVEVKIKSLGSSLDLKVKETYPSQIKIYDPAGNIWITDNPWISDVHVDSYATNYFRYYALTPDTQGTYTLQTDIGYQAGSDFQIYKSLNTQITVGNFSTTVLTDNIITSLKALKVSLLEKLTVYSAVQYMESVKNRNNNQTGTKAVYESDMSDILKALDAVMILTSCDTKQVRLMMDMLLRTYESKYYLE